MSQDPNKDYEYLAKLLIIGESRVGKTCLLQRFFEEAFQASHISTIGIDLKRKTLQVDDKKIKMEIWDTSGQERFKAITQTYYKGSMGVILTYAVDFRDSFNKIETWMKQVKLNASENICKVLVGNKSDVAEDRRKVSTEEGMKLAESYGIQFFETSAKDDKNIKGAFQAIAKEIIEKLSIEKQPLKDVQAFFKEINPIKLAQDVELKMMIIGDSGVGKTCLMQRFCENLFCESHLPTIGINFKNITLQDGQNSLQFKIWDTSGQGRFKEITQTYYKGSMGVILTYAVDDRDSFNNIETWMKQVKGNASENICKILVGNKSDVAEDRRKVSTEEGMKLAESYAIQFFETSAKDEKNINGAFQAIAKEIIEKNSDLAQKIKNISLDGKTFFENKAKDDEEEKNDFPVLTQPLKATECFNYSVEILIIGDLAVGKTCLIQRFCGNSFTTSHLSTIGLDFISKNQKDGHTNIKFMIFDASGQERFRSLIQTYCTTAKGVILTYAVDDRDSFNNIETWMKQVKLNASENICKVLVGNKSDVAEDRRKVSTEEGMKLAESYGIQFFETSAKDEKNINGAFQAIAKEIIEKIPKQTLKNDDEETKE